VKVTLPDGRVLTNHVTSSTGYACASDPAAHFGLGRHEAPAKVRERAGTEPGRNYPPPIVDHGAARDEALAAFATLRGQMR